MMLINLSGAQTFNTKSRMLVLLAITFIASSAYASNSGAGECSKEPGAAFEKSDAVVLAQVESIQSKEWTPETATEPTIVNVKVKKYWKLGKEIPTSIHAPSKTYFQDTGLYLLYLKRYDDNSSDYILNRCAPFTRILGSEADINTILFLNKKEIHNVD